MAMADGTFRRLVRDEEIRREEYLDRQLELGWEEMPADRLPEGPGPADPERLLEGSELEGDPSLGRLLQRASRRAVSLRPRRPSTAFQASRQTSLGS